MAKVPVLGRVKTRLGRDIGGVAAARFYRAAVHALVRRLGADTRWQTVLAVSPDAQTLSGALPHLAARRPQGTGDLGGRMQRVMTTMPPGPVVIIGTDIPAIQPDDIASAFRQLGRRDAVFGPAPDGGYWLVGYKRVPRVPRAFGHVRWSTQYALADTLANLQRERCTITQLRALEDVDDLASYAKAKSWFGRRVLPTEVASGAEPWWHGDGIRGLLSNAL
ncbi:MAG: TIGR04282 family arsenosugar biosynthesis glycosyltransferase [Pseudomonadota bacterium]